METAARRPLAFLAEWLLLTAALLVLGGFVAYSLFEEHSAVGSRERERLAAQAKVIHDNLGRQLFAINRALANVRDELPVWEKEKSGMALANRRLGAFTDALTGVRTMLTIDALGTVRASSRTEFVGMNFSHRDYFQAARNNPHPDSLYVSPPFKSVLGPYIFSVTRMIVGPQGEFAGVVTAAIDPQEFKILLGSVLYAPDMWASIAHGNGTLFMRLPDPEGVAGTDMKAPGSFFTQHMASGQMATVLTGITHGADGQRMAAHQTVQPAGLFMDNALVVAVARDVDALYAPWRQEVRARGALFGLLLLSSVTGLYLLQRRRRSAIQETIAIEAALREKSAELERFFNVTLDLLCIADTSGCFKKLNSAWEARLGYSRTQLENACLLDFVHPDDKAATLTALTELAAGEPAVKFTQRFRSAAGDYRTLEWHATPQDQLIYAAARDVTERKAMEVALIEAKLAAEAASSAKGQFLANMSHEIRTPMNAVLGLLQLLQHTELTDRQRDYAQKSHAAAQSLLGILNDILDFSKVEAGKMEIENAPFRLDQLLRNLSVVLSTAVARKNVEVLFDIGADIPRVLNGDALRLQQVLLNLAGNAVKFTAHGEVVLSLRILESTPKTVRVEFAVRDSGIGIAADKLKSIFEGFTQAEASTGRRFGGTGLGLAISQRLVRLMGGELAVSSTPAHGSRFSFILEFSRGNEAGVSTTELRSDAAQPLPLRVLIVDDNATARAVLADTVARLGWQADAVTSGAEALARLDAGVDGQPRYDAIFVDWQMPDMDGWETALRIRALRRAGQIPLIIMITAHGREVLAHRLESAANPLDGFLVKPVTASMLFDALADANAGRGTSLERRAIARPLSCPLAGLHLLLVEDNPTNQQVARELLEIQGAQVDVAGNGRQGIEYIAAAERPYDAVLMDIQMPDMDGFTATRILRGKMGLHQLPIIAMTANALPVDRENCLAAGMNDHVGKPIDVETLVATLLRHCTHTPPAPASLPQPQTAAATAPLPELPPGFALADALARLGNNRAAYARILEIFQQDQQTLRERLRQALQQDDQAAAARELHTLKGLAGTLGASALADFARNAETAVKNGHDPATIATLPDRLDAKLDATLAVLASVAAQFAPDSAPAPAQPLVDSARLSAVLEALEALLANHNLRALDAHSALQQDFGTVLGAKLTPLDTAIARMDFTAALTASQVLRRSLTS
ncbi:MAG: response regulator [Gammaproteobacteria bacterium]|nr:response regulator [Rhodocyclaceae bacterium]MBU3907639.1 response regulator [Gammaproteobacteria bacterium]MBU3990873.1 response regulator [Gammaproteobacteria bacterium]MBU4004285.1 response regulator [Gammaproteobacteria bacterium]MBU4019694.1 response regulator [Gammaproteobacteria bacterium]